MDGGDGDEEGRGFSGQGARQVVSLRVPRGRVREDHRWTSAGLGVARHLVSPTGRSLARGPPHDVFRPEQTQGPLQPEAGILSILVMPWERAHVEGDGDHPRFTVSFRASPASPGSCRPRRFLVELPRAGQM